MVKRFLRKILERLVFVSCNCLDIWFVDVDYVFAGSALGLRVEGGVGRKPYDARG